MVALVALKEEQPELEHSLCEVPALLHAAQRLFPMVTAMLDFPAPKYKPDKSLYLETIQF